MSDYRIHLVRPEDAEQVRSMRLAMLQDTPMAYLETYEQAVACTAAEWTERAGRGTRPGSTSYSAVERATGAWVGGMNGYVPEDSPDTAWLVGVWVHPDHRGGRLGVTDALLDAVTGWARDSSGASRLLLEVHESNARAIAYYERRGFVRTGRTVPYPLDPSAQEYEMELPLR
ncbi:GNAT family N-acetyltransferase [Streptacidiphilus carbonis]|jgi:ribosomal protein S18 acetylase RimI-like enzyme|uniref:GNAT family N-acetyltransferase n=1 Tax=Streptacidiphilus carbonis TaxID=105422 RepID=UPI0005A8A581|nr:GNAT family N-acetyltransferase [Streptacidiphilus carbonis]